MVTSVFEVPAEKVPKTVRPRMANVHVRIHREAARVDPNDLGLRWDKRFFFLGERVVNVQSHDDCRGSREKETRASDASLCAMSSEINAFARTIYPVSNLSDTLEPPCLDLGFPT